MHSCARVVLRECVRLCGWLNVNACACAHARAWCGLCVCARVYRCVSVGCLCSRACACVRSCAYVYKLHNTTPPSRFLKTVPAGVMKPLTWWGPHARTGARIPRHLHRHWHSSHTHSVRAKTQTPTQTLALITYTQRARENPGGRIPRHRQTQ